MNILLAGATGLVGSKTLQFLIEDQRVSKIIVVSRKKSEIHNEKIINIVGELSQLTKEKINSFGINNIDSALCALGTTIKNVKTKEAFRSIDLDLVIHIASVSKELGASRFSVISAQNANINSSVFYSKVKGEMEALLMKKEFNSLTIIRPGLLLGNRDEFRLVEKIFILLSPILNSLLIGNLKKYRGVNFEKVAYCLFQSAFEKKFGQRIIENLEILES